MTACGSFAKIAEQGEDIEVMCMGSEELASAM